MADTSGTTFEMSVCSGTCTVSKKVVLITVGVALAVVIVVGIAVAAFLLTRHQAPAVEVECGVPRSVQLLVIDGKDAIPHEFPWQVFYEELDPSESDKLNLCGGSVVDERWIVTAAHCLHEGVPATVYLGKHDLVVFEEGQLIRQVEAKIRHPLYDNITNNYDIALVKLGAPVNFAEYPHITPICLPSKGDFASFDGKNCIASGWGRTSLKHADIANRLQKISIEVISEDECRKRTPRLITPRMLCGVPEISHGDVCEGDSGGPLQCLQEGRSVLAGVVSYGDCGQLPMPTIYGRVSEMIDWIEHVRREHEVA